jgi:hypothetical protein
VGRAFVGMPQPIPAKTDQPNEPLHHRRNRHSYTARPTRMTKQPILISVAGNELRPLNYAERDLSATEIRELEALIWKQLPNI